MLRNRPAITVNGPTTFTNVTFHGRKPSRFAWLRIRLR